MGIRKVAIACQGGGTHAAFTWGVLTEILRTKKAWDAEAGETENIDIVAISGTSAGALCALATWYGMMPNLADVECGTLDKAIERLDFLWTTFTATTPIEQAHNTFLQGYLQAKENGAPFPDLNPYGGYGKLALLGLAVFGARQEYLGFPSLWAAAGYRFGRALLRDTDL